MKLINTLMLLTVSTGWSQIARSESVIATKTEGAKIISDVSVELKPLPTMLSFIPGVGAVGLAVEAFVGYKTSIFAEVAAINSNLPHFYDSDVQNRDKLYPRNFSGGSADLGARYYGWLFSDSWYTGAKVGYMASDAKWEYKDQSVNHSVVSLTPGVEAGYRWLWPSKFLMRFGIGATANVLQSQNVTSDVENEDIVKARSDLKSAARSAVLAKIDLGVGYQF